MNEPVKEPIIQNNILLLEEKRSIFKARAKVLAVERKDNSVLNQFIEIIEFSVAAETYGIESDFISEVYLLKDFTILPGLPSFVFGIINVRGQIISLISLKRLFGLPEKGIRELNKVIIIHNNRMEFGILADIILGSYAVSLDEIQKNPIQTNLSNAGYFKGVTNDHIIILDAKNILNDEKIIIHQKSE
ncbi:MAG: chemotaxis protein CheW [Ignavibacteriaceae bacterium]